MDRIRMTTPLVEMDGDEMTRVLWALIKEKLLLPHVDLEVRTFDLGLPSRNATDDRVTIDAAEAIRELGVGVKCATITPNADRVKEYGLTKQLSSPNGTIRAFLGGTVFRKPIVLSNILPAVRSWRRPIIVGRHAYGDVYSNTELAVSGPGLAELVFTPASGEPSRATIVDFDGPGIVQGIYNKDDSIEGFARSCFEYGLDQKVDVWFATKDTISKTYDQRFRSIFAQVFERDFRGRFERAGIGYSYSLIDDLVARIMKSEGGILWACKNYDGDVMSDMLGSAYGSLAMMTSVLVSPQGFYEFEASHGTVQKHYYKHLKGERTSSNSMALIFAWSGCLRKRGELDNTPEVVEFADKLEAAAKETVESGIMTGDLMLVAKESSTNKKVYTEEFIDEVAMRLEKKLK